MIYNWAILSGLLVGFVGSYLAYSVYPLIKKLSSVVCCKDIKPETHRFKDNEDGVFFEYYNKPPEKFSFIKMPATDGQKTGYYRINTALLVSYLIYRREFVRSYGGYSNLAQDIKYPQTLRIPELKGQITYLTATAKLNVPEKGLDEYSIAIALGAMQRWNNFVMEHMQSFIAYANVNGVKTELGFVLFQEKTSNGHQIIYIAEAAVSERNHSIGRRLMECVLVHFPAGTEFQVLTRNFNSAAINLYQKRLNFELLTKEDICRLGYNNARYVGFKYITTEYSLKTIKAKLEPQA